MTVRSALLTPHFHPRSISRIHPKPLVVMFCAADHVVVRFAINTLEFLSTTYGIFSHFLRMKATIIKMGKRTTDGAADHFSLYDSIPPIIPAMFIWTSFRRVMTGTAPGARSVTNLLWQKAPAEDTVSAIRESEATSLDIVTVLGAVTELAAVVAGGGELAGGPVIHGLMMEGVANTATDFLATDAEWILPQLFAVDLPTFLCEMIIGEAMTALELLAVHPNPVGTPFLGVDAILTEMTEGPALKAHFLFAKNIFGVLSPRLILGTVIEKMICNTTEVTTIEF